MIHKQEDLSGIHPNSQCYQIRKNYVPKWKATAGNLMQVKEKVKQGKQFKDLAGAVPAPSFTAVCPVIMCQKHADVDSYSNPDSRSPHLT